MDASSGNMSLCILTIALIAETKHAVRPIERQGPLVRKAQRPGAARRHQGVSSHARFGADSSVSLEGRIPKHSYTELLEREDLRHSSLDKRYVHSYICSDGSDLADLYVTCQLWTDGKAETLPLRTAWKDFARSYM